MLVLPYESNLCSRVNHVDLILLHSVIISILRGCSHQFSHSRSIRGTAANQIGIMPYVKDVAQVDKEAGRIFQKFRAWCKRHFGSVHQCFFKLDVDGENEISFTTFRTACKRWDGFDSGDLTQLIATVIEGSETGSGMKKTLRVASLYRQ